MLIIKIGGIKMPGIVEKIKEMWNPSDEYYEENEEIQETVTKEEPKLRSIGNNKIVNINSGAKVKVVLSRPEHFDEEIKNIADELLKMHTVVLNLEVTPKSESRRLVDFLSGIAYAINGKIKKVSTDTFVVTPSNVDIEGEDLLSEFENKGVYF